MKEAAQSDILLQFGQLWLIKAQLVQDEDLLRPIALGLFTLLLKYPEQQLVSRLDEVLKLCLTATEARYVTLEDKSLRTTGVPDPTSNVDLRSFVLEKLNEFSLAHSQLFQTMAPTLQPIIQQLQLKK